MTFRGLGLLTAALALLGGCGKTASDGSGGSSGIGGSGGSVSSGGTGGVGGSGGTGATAGVPGLTSTDKVDLLFVVDNSISMADKQAVFASSVPRLLQRLVAPRCLDASGAPTGASAPCPAGSQPEFPPIQDLHVGVITSSLGSHGGNVCGDEPPANDRARLLPSVRSGLPDPNGLGFLTWKTGDDVLAMINDFAQHIIGAGESGCGFEAGLESWYRFLVDPNPPEQVTYVEGATVAVGTDVALLEQRKGFLRPDSLLAIIHLSDENDCSIRDSDVGWYVSTIVTPQGTPYPMAAPSPACATDPNSPDCQSCAALPIPPGCEGIPPLDPASTDKVNLRCWDQKRRFGIDFLYPSARYVNALSRKQLCPSDPALDPAGCEGPLVDNPLFTDLSGSNQPTRSSELVLFMGIVGVPWQDLATPASLNDPNALELMPAQDLPWHWITGSFGDPPDDPLMIESTEPRTGVSPATGSSLASPDSPPGANSANGHEWNAHQTSQGDLQFACIFPLAQPRDCSVNTGSGCDCKMVSSGLNNPLCQSPNGTYSTTQYHAKAYPGRRELDVLQAVGQQAVVSSICPKISDPSNPAYGYNPSLDALVRAMVPRLKAP